MRHVHVRLSEEDYEVLKRMAYREDRPLSSMVRSLIRKAGTSGGFYTMKGPQPVQSMKEGPARR